LQAKLKIFILNFQLITLQKHL